MRGTFAEIGVGVFGLIIWPILAQIDVAAGAVAESSLRDWLQFGLSVALVLIHTLWTIPGMQKEARDERRQFLDELAKNREGFKCHGAAKSG